MTNITWDELATLIDLDGKTPIVGSMLVLALQVLRQGAGSHPADAARLSRRPQDPHMDTQSR